MRVVRGCGVYRDVEQATNGIADTKRGHESRVPGGLADGKPMIDQRKPPDVCG